MAKKNEILLSIALDGDSEVKRKLVDVGESGKRSLDNIGKRLGGASNALGGIKEAAGGLREALAPLTQASGLGGLLGGGLLGGLLSRLASPAGVFAGLGAAVTAALVGMAKIGEETVRLQGRLTALGDNKGLDRLAERAKKSGASAAELEPRYERFLAFEQKVNASTPSVTHPPGFEAGAAQEAAAGVRVFSGGAQTSAPSRKAFDDFDKALRAQIRRDVKTKEEAETKAAAFQEGLFTTGLTPDLLRSLPPNAGKLVTSQLAKPLGQGFENPEAFATAIEQGRVPRQQLNATSVINAVGAPNPQFDKAALDARGITQKFEELNATIDQKRSEAIGTNGDQAGFGGAADALTTFINSRGPYRRPKTLSEIGASIGSFAGGVGSLFDSTLQAPVPALPPPGQIETPNARVSQGFSAAGEIQAAGGDVAAALKEAAQKIRESSGAGAAPPAVQGRATGGRISGPGSSTSDSIPIMASDGEYVVNAAATSKVGLRYLDAINAGKPPGYADGGSVIPGLSTSALSSGNYNITATDDGGAIINGAYYPAGSPVLSDPTVRQALERSRRQGQQSNSGGGQKTHKSEFTGIFGGHVFDTPGSYARGGPVGHIDAPGFVQGYAWGGSVDGPAPSVSGISPPGGGGVEGYHKIDLTTNGGTFGVMAPGDVARAMASAARDSADVQTGPRPSWYRGK